MVDGGTQFLAAVTLSALLHGQLLLRRQECASKTKPVFGHTLTEVTAFLPVSLLVGSESQVLPQRALMWQVKTVEVCLSLSTALSFR